MDPSTFLAGGQIAIDIGNLIVGTAGILQNQVASAPPISPSHRRRAPERELAYLRFQHAAVELTSWVEYLPVLKAAAPSPTTIRLYALALAAQDRPNTHRQADRTIDRTHIPALLSRDGWAKTLEKVELLDSSSSMQYMPVLLGAMERFRAATAGFLGALMEIRQAGGPKPRQAAERITALLGELCSLVSVGLTPWWQRTLAAAFGRAEAPKRKRQELDACRQLLAEAHRDFTMAVRDDLGRERRPRRFRWQAWRPKARIWPGGWPGEDAAQLIADRVRGAGRDDQLHLERWDS